MMMREHILRPRASTDPTVGRPLADRRLTLSIDIYQNKLLITLRLINKQVMTYEMG